VITRAQKIRLGVFVLFALLILFGLLAAVLGSFLWETRDNYAVAYDISVSGLEIGAPVKYNGVRVGRVERIRIDPLQVSRTLVAFSLDAGTPVKENTRAVLNVQGITGLKFIELVGGTSEAPTLAPGAEIPPGTSTMDKLTGQAESISIKAELLINQLMALTGDENRALLTDVLERGGSLMNNVDNLIERNTGSVEELLKNLAGAADRLSGTLEEIRRAAQESREAVAAVRRAAEGVLDSKRVAGVLDEARGTLEDLHRRVGADEFGKVTAALHQLAQRTQALVEKLDLVVMRSREDVQASLRFLTETAENMRDFSRLIREDPSRLLRSQERRERVLP
jgi:phospholipid/cholesterol/gamma-HCH transport system substrate-binding protein